MTSAISCSLTPCVPKLISTPTSSGVQEWRMTLPASCATLFAPFGPHLRRTKLEQPTQLHFGQYSRGSANREQPCVGRPLGRPCDVSGGCPVYPNEITPTPVGCYAPDGFTAILKPARRSPHKFHTRAADGVSRWTSAMWWQGARRLPTTD